MGIGIKQPRKEYARATILHGFNYVGMACCPNMQVTELTYTNEVLCHCGEHGVVKRDATDYILGVVVGPNGIQRI